MTPFIGYVPDLDPQTPGAIVDCSGVVPSVKGFKSAPAPVSTALPALAAACYGAASIRKTDDTTRIFAGTASKLYEGATTAWTDRTGTAPSLGTNERWRFAQFGDSILAAAKSSIVQFIDSATAFAACTTTAPKCGDVEAVNNFVIGFDVNDQGSLFDSADRPNGWWCAAKGGFADWNPSITTESATGTLKETPGKITGAKAFGYQCVAYKQTSMYIGTYVGQPVIWDWQLIPGSAGALSKAAIVNVGTPENPKHIFMGADNFYEFSGAVAVPIGNPIREKVFGELNIQYYYAAQGLHDAVNKRVYFFYPSSPQITPDKCVVYNYLTGRWGRDDRTIEAVMDYLATGVTYTQLGTYYSTYADLPNAPYDTAFAVQGTPIPGIVDTTHTLKTLTGASSSSSITPGVGGDGKNYYTMTRLIPWFLSAPATATFTHYYKAVLSDMFTTGVQVTMSSGRFDLMESARWHSGRLDMTGDWEITGIEPQMTVDGEE